MHRVLPALLLLVVGCASPPDLTPLPDPGDDDDSVIDEPVEGFASLATFAVAMEGEVDDSDAPSTIHTKGEGVFQFLYWDEDGETPLCRQRVPFLSDAHFGPLAASSCGGCLGMLELTAAVEDSSGDPPADACTPEQLGSQDLSFLLLGDDADPERGDDFTRLALIGLDELLSDDWLLTADGLHVEELIATYEAAGLAATHLAMVRPSGWVGHHAGLDGIATPWGTQGWLPMFVVYRDADRPVDADWLPGEVYMTSLWQVALAEPETGSDPEGDSASYR